jgi:tetratricopeptide (TPR) repeat protein
LIGKIKPHLIEIGIFLIVTLLLSIGTHSRNRLWNDEIGLWIDCVKKSPNKARPYINLGLAYFNAGAYDKSQEMAQKAIQIDPKSAYAYYNLSLTFQKMGDLNKAIAMGKKSLEIDPTLYMASYSLGGFYFENGQYEESTAAYQKFLRVFPYFPETHNLLAVAYAAQKKFDKAIAEFEWELRVNPYHTLAHLNLGQIYWYEFQNREKAIYHLRAALMLDPLLPNRRAIQRLVRSLEGFS